MSDPTDAETFIRSMRHLRRLRGWSQERLADEVRSRGRTLSSTAITKLEWILDPERAKQARGLTFDEAIAIAQVFGSSPMAMCGQEDTNPRATVAGSIASIYAVTAREFERLTQEQAEVAQRFHDSISSILAVIEE